MKSIKRFLNMLALVCLIGMWVWSCAPTHLLRVHYQLPLKSDSLEGINASLSFKDIRENKDMLSNSAKEALSDFSGNFTLVVAHENGSGKLLGVYELASMLIEVFKQSLQHAGINISEKKDLEIEIEFVLKEFMLDFESRNWIISMTYQTNLLKEGNIIISETINGKAERYKVVGNREAEKVIGELLTDMINKLDVQQLFRQAGLHPL
ncbi:MAG: hypothetical protein JSV31_31575 [Desulfobacterales bacterium]|nr:MAG: hypothetical protein JSV31_31575 [Desulfobacterales bacterium]